MIFGGAETDHRSDVVGEIHVVDFISASSGSTVVVMAAAVDVVTASDSRSSLTRGGAETTVTRASPMSDLVLERKPQSLRLENDDGDGVGARDVLLVTSAGRAL